MNLRKDILISFAVGAVFCLDALVDARDMWFSANNMDQAINTAADRITQKCNAEIGIENSEPYTFYQKFIPLNGTVSVKVISLRSRDGGGTIFHMQEMKATGGSRTFDVPTNCPYNPTTLAAG